ncbi:MAG: hypothetical protein M1404_07780 [Acidobacteria bacterium]|nr:hypothetical protein [Acidobacteriota bacterium]
MKLLPFFAKRVAQPQRGYFRVLVVLTMLVGASLSGSRLAYAWGPKAHRLCNDWAIGTLPGKLHDFFQANRSFILAHSNDPEMWIKKDRYERMRQYIFLDKYGLFPYLGLPESYEMAVKKYGSGRIVHNGVLPWQIGEYSLKLTEALNAGNWEEVKLDAAALGFYVADAHDPLHTTRNYDGQLTDQKGLATRFGTELVDRYSHFFIFRPDDATKIDDPTEHAFQMVLEANTWVDQIILADRRARDGLPGYTDEYYDRFYSRVGSTAMREISEAAHDIGSYWYTAWLNAGRPELPK